MTLIRIRRKGKGIENVQYVRGITEVDRGEPWVDLGALGDAVKTFRAQTGKTLKELSEYCNRGISVSQLHRVENKLRPPDILSYVRLCWMLGVKPTYFIVSAKIPGVGPRETYINPVVGLMKILMQDYKLTPNQRQALLDSFAATYRALTSENKD